MNIEQIYTGCLAQGTYYIRSGNEAVIIDPLREVEPYIQRAQKDGVKITHIFETHFHADFVSGHLTLSKKTGAPIIYGPNANPSYDAHIASDGEEFKVGEITIRAIHTPGHTMESTTYLVIDQDEKEHAIFSGDTLFLGDVGRPDLAQKAADMTQKDLAGLLYESLRNKIMTLPDHVIVYPAHGAGSACGKKMMKVTVDTLGNQKEVNYALRSDMTKEEFIKEVTDGLLPPPGYFPANVKLNKEGYQHIDQVLSDGLRQLAPAEFESIANESGARMLDVRTPFDFATGHIPNSLFIGLDGSFAPWVGELIIDAHTPILLIADEGREKEAVIRLSRVGFDNTLGYLVDGLEAWEDSGREVATVSTCSAQQFAEINTQQQSELIDVRKESEHQSTHVNGSKNIPLTQLNLNLNRLSKEGRFYVHCAGGYRSMIAISILKSRGYHNAINVDGGMKALEDTQLEISEYVCRSTLS